VTCLRLCASLATSTSRLPPLCGLLPIIVVDVSLDGDNAGLCRCAVGCPLAILAMATRAPPPMASDGAEGWQAHGSTPA
jgi:hypothetical protein